MDMSKKLHSTFLCLVCNCAEAEKWVYFVCDSDFEEKKQQITSKTELIFLLLFKSTLIYRNIHRDVKLKVQLFFCVFFVEKYI